MQSINIVRVTKWCIFFASCSCSTNLTEAKKETTRHLDADSVRSFNVFGPGLLHNFVVPARYFFIQRLLSVNGTSMMKKDEFDIEMQDRGGRPARVYLHILDRQDESFIVRYKVQKTYANGIIINVKYHGNHIADSPYILDGVVYPEACNCPQVEERWLAAMSCPKNYKQIHKDLDPFTAINVTSSLRAAKTRFSSRGSYSFCHYAIKDNKLYRECFGQHVGFKMFMDSMLLSLMRKVRLPNVEFLSNLGDWPLENGINKEKGELLAMFSWCGSDDTYDIVMPTYDITESTLETMGRVMLDMLSVQANTGPPWAEKINKALFRGRDSRQERLDLAKLAQKHPDKLDVGITNYFFFKQDDQLYGPKQKHVSFFEFFKYRYQLNIDGTVAAYRFPYLLAGDSLVLKQDSPYYEYFYKRLAPYKHYVPVKRDLSDLMTQLEWVMANEEKVVDIIRNAQTFARDNLLASDIYCYYFQLFTEYSKKLVAGGDVVIADSMEHVDHPEVHPGQCDCIDEDTVGAKQRDEL